MSLPHLICKLTDQGWEMAQGVKRLLPETKNTGLDSSILGEIQSSSGHL